MAIATSTSQAKKATRKKARKTTKRTTAVKAVKKVVEAAAAATPKMTGYASNPMASLSHFSMPESTTEAMQKWSGFFKQPSSLKMESLMPATLPQFEQFQTQMQSATAQYSTFLNKATKAAEKSRTCLTTGLEECSKTAASMAQSNMQRCNEGMRKLMACKSLNEFADVQNQLFKQNFETMSAETAKLVEQLTKTMASATEPMNDLAASAMTEAKKSMAA